MDEPSPSSSPRIAVVTGASAGIGRATARALSAAGVPVVAVARRRPELESLAGEAPGAPIEVVEADVAREAGRQVVFDAVGRRSVSALVHGAGVFPRGLMTSLTAAEWAAALETNFTARLWLTLGLRDALGGGRVLFVGSDAARTPRNGGAAYSVSKAASAMLCRCFAGELGDRIAFGIARPGLVETSMLDESLAAPRERFPAGEVYAAMQARGETISPETIADFFRWLLVDVPAPEFASEDWDVRDVRHHPRWLAGPLYRGG